MHAEPPYVLEVLHADVRGCVLKRDAGADLIRAVRGVTGGAVYLSPKISPTVVEAVRTGVSTPETD